MKTRKKVLIFSHAVTMAHFTRPLRLVDGLDPALYDIYFASDAKYKTYFDQKAVTFIGIQCLDAVDFNETVVNAAPIYDAATFHRHVEEDLRVIEIVRPDLVVGDFRHSLSVSARLAKVKYVNITNAYWSPDTVASFPLPEAPVVRKLGESVSRILIAPFAPIALRFNFFKMAFMLRKEFRRVGRFFWDYRRVITDGDVAVYCDTPALVPLTKAREDERFVGPLTWSADASLPEWWSRLNPKKKRIFLTLGSSGPADSLPLIITALAKLDVEIIVALAGKKLNLLPFENVHITQFLPIKEACEQTDLVICNGGSPLCHAALTYGVPTLGIVCNNDQLLNMAHVESRNAGVLLRFWNLTEEKIVDAVKTVLEDASFAKHAAEIQRELAGTNAVKAIAEIIDEILQPEPVSPAIEILRSSRARFDHLEKE